MSFYVLIKSYILTRLTRVIKGRPAEYQYDALKPEKKSFSQKLKISLLQSEKSLFISLKLKKRKKTFFGQIGLEFSARHGQTVSKRIFKVESVERKSNFAYKNIFRQKYF